MGTRLPLVRVRGGAEALGADGVAARLVPDGMLALEVGFGQAADVAALVRAAGLTNVTIRKDYGDVERLVLATR